MSKGLCQAVACSQDSSHNTAAVKLPLAPQFAMLEMLCECVDMLHGKVQLDKELLLPEAWKNMQQQQSGCKMGFS